MTTTLSEQMLSFVAAYLGGIILGVVYEIFRIIRHLLLNSKITTFVCDFLFMILFAFVTLFFSMAYSFGRTRLFTLFSEVCGLLSVRFTLGLVSLRLFSKFYGYITCFLKKILIKSKKITKKLLQPKDKMMYNRIKKKDAVTSGSVK